MTDEEKLVLAAKELDPAAWTHMYDGYYRTIYAYVYRRVGNSSLAEDLTASVFIRALEGIGKYKYRGTPLIAWFLTITHNMVVDPFRRNGRAPEVPLNLKLVSRDPSPDQIAEANLQKERLHKALGRLTEDQRQVVTLRFIDGLNISEVSHLLDRPEGTIKALQHRAIGSLRRIMTEEVRDEQGLPSYIG